MNMERLADQLIEVAEHCGSNQISAVYRFLLHALGGDERAARAEFVRYLQGNLSSRMLKLSHAAINSRHTSSDREWHSRGRSADDRQSVIEPQDVESERSSRSTMSIEDGDGSMSKDMMMEDIRGL